MRRCARCGETLPLEAFGKARSNPLGRHYVCRPCARKYAKEMYHKHRDKRLARQLRYQREYYWGLRKELVRKLGGKCVVCGITDIRVLQVNHLNGGGKKEFRNSHNKDYTTFLRDVVRGVRGIEDLDLRCANHNVLYEYEVGRRVLLGGD